jgi:transposase
MDERRELSDEQWEQLRPHLPPQKPPFGKPNRDHRTIVEGMLWRLRTGAPWRDLPERYGPWQTVYSRFRRWQRADVWERALQRLQAEGDATGDLDWALHFIDGTTVRAHQHAAGAKKGAVIRPLAAPAADSPAKSTCAPKAGASRSSSS